MNKPYARNVTLILSYYENQEMLDRQLRFIEAMKPRVKERLTLIVVDDGSPTKKAEDVYRNPDIREARLYRMKVDIPWNQDACRNLAMRESPNEWALMTDMDHLVPEQTMEWCMNAELRELVAYKFSRVSAPDMEPYKPHPNSWLISKTLYDKFDGYNEQYAGIYGTDGDFARDLMRHGCIRQSEMPLIRVPIEVVSDACTVSFQRKTEWSDLMKTAIRKSKLPRARGIFPWKRLR